MSTIEPAGLPGDPEAFTLITEINIISHLASTLFESRLPRGMTDAQFGVLNHLIRLDTTQTIGELARAFQVRQPTMSSTVRRLENRGLIELRPDPGDRRIRRVAVTRAGELARSEGLEVAASIETELGPVLEPDEIAAILPALGKLRAALDAARD